MIPKWMENVPVTANQSSSFQGSKMEFSNSFIGQLGWLGSFRATWKTHGCLSAARWARYCQFPSISKRWCNVCIYISLSHNIFIIHIYIWGAFQIGVPILITQKLTISVLKPMVLGIPILRKRHIYIFMYIYIHIYSNSLIWKARLHHGMIPRNLTSNKKGLGRTVRPWWNLPRYYIYIHIWNHLNITWQVLKHIYKHNINIIYICIYIYILPRYINITEIIWIYQSQVADAGYLATFYS